MKIISVVGARPNFIKVSSIHKAIQKYNKHNNSSTNHAIENYIHHLICHTGQHYNDNMSKIFFEDLELPEPEFYLGVGSGSHAEQTAKIMMEFEKVLLNEKPDMIIVVGDVNSTIACSLVARKMGIKISHVEAGLRSFDNSMPEEVNRILTDHISDYLFVTEKSGLQNLSNEGIPASKVFFVGNVMIDSLYYYLPKSEKSKILEKYSLIKSNLEKVETSLVQSNSFNVIYEQSADSYERVPYILLTLHRPSNVDSREFMEELVNLLNTIGEKSKVVFPVHPRTRKNMFTWQIDKKFTENIILIDPVGYLDFIALIKNSSMVITDSGGIQEETTVLGIQCFTIRVNTERPVTVEVGTNQLLGTDLKKVGEVVLRALNEKNTMWNIPELWDGKAGERIVEILINKLKV